MARCSLRLRFANLSRAVDGGFVVRLVSVTDNTSAADHARYREMKKGFKFLKSPARGNFVGHTPPRKISP
jgi:hypothetical protein